MRIVNFIIQKLKNKHTLNDKIHSYVITYSEVSIKRPGLNFFQRDSIKRPGPFQFYVELQKNVLFLLNDLVFFEKSLLNYLVSI